MTPDDEPIRAGVGPSEISGRKATVLAALGDPLSRGVLLRLNDAPRSAQDLLGSLNVSQSTLYRRLRELEESGLIGVERFVISEDGKKSELFRSLLEEAEVRFEGSSLDVQFKFRDLTAERLSELWSGVRREVRK